MNTAAVDNDKHTGENETDVDIDVKPLLTDSDQKGNRESNREKYEVKSCCSKLFSALYGDLPYEDRLRAAWLSGTLFFIIGGYWLMRSLKDTVLATIVGLQYQPMAKVKYPSYGKIVFK